MSKYVTFKVTIVSGEALKFITVVACDIASAHADIQAAYGENVEIVSTGQV